MQSLGETCMPCFVVLCVLQSVGHVALGGGLDNLYWSCDTMGGHAVLGRDLYALFLWFCPCFTIGWPRSPWGRPWTTCIGHVTQWVAMQSLGEVCIPCFCDFSPVLQWVGYVALGRGLDTLYCSCDWSLRSPFTRRGIFSEQKLDRQNVVDTDGSRIYRLNWDSSK